MMCAVREGYTRLLLGLPYAPTLYHALGNPTYNTRSPHDTQHVTIYHIRKHKAQGYACGACVAWRVCVVFTLPTRVLHSPPGRENGTGTDSFSSHAIYNVSFRTNTHARYTLLNTFGTH